MREENQVQILLKIVTAFRHSMPLHRFLSSYYTQHKEMGSRDRKQFSSLLFNFYRLGKALPDLRIEERIAIGNYLCESTSYPLLEHLISKFSKADVSTLDSPTDDKIRSIGKLYPGFSVSDIFPFTNLLSPSIDRSLFARSFLTRPKVYIRMCKKYTERVVAELQEKNIPFNKVEGSPLALVFEPAVQLDTLPSYKNGWFEIQDISSQRTGEFFNANSGEYWWDCCAASGGKSLMLVDQCEDLHLRVSDLRESMLENLRQRFMRAGIRKFEYMQADLSQAPQMKKTFDGIIADLPCSGSGTWARTPEMIAGFDIHSPGQYALKQKTILKNIVPFLKKGKSLIYITCSVFKEENEDIAEFISSELKLEMTRMEIIPGYESASDTMFAASFIKT
jgi:16S rRNA (cytosine967-C5)-methyltransferase